VASGVCNGWVGIGRKGASATESKGREEAGLDVWSGVRFFKPMLKLIHLLCPVGLPCTVWAK